ncbi:MAG: hypothetical protein ACI9QA_000956 [Methanobacteriota archaeon]|jgi:hypothetical protein
MRRRQFVSALSVAGATGVTGCIGNGEGNETDGNRTDGNTTDGDGADGATVTGTSFSTSPVRGGDIGESASYSFEDGSLNITGVIVGSDACKVAELGSAVYDEERGAIVVSVTTVNADDANRRMCAQVLTPIRYEATVGFDGGQPEVVVTHDGEEVGATEGVGGDRSETNTTVTDSEFEVTASGCGEEVDEAEYTATQGMSEGDESIGIVEGTLSGPDSCTTAELGYTSYDAEDDTLVADVRTARTDDDACQDCITEVGYRLEATFENGVAGSASVSHDGVVVDGIGDGIETAGFTVEGRENASGDEGAADIGFDEDEGRIVVSGTVVGKNGCATARLSEANVEDGTLNVGVGTVSDGTEVCTQALVAIGYEATFSFDGEIPDEVSVSHDGTGVMSGAYASESTSASNVSE